MRTPTVGNARLRTLAVLVLLAVGTFLYGESFSFRTGSGMALCVAGLLLLR